MPRVMLLAVLALAGCKASEAPEPLPSATVTGAAESVQAPAPAVPPAPPVAGPERFQALGTEPFWSVEVLENGQLRYATPERQEGALIAATLHRSGGVLAFAGTLAGERFALAITPGTCSDGMSDNSYPFSATLTLGARRERGCARLR